MNRALLMTAAVCSLLASSGRAGPPAPPSPASAPESEHAAGELRDVFPHVRINPAERFVEIDARVPITLDDPEAPHVYLELIACIPDSKEHEVLVVSPARPSHIHAALLLLGLEPGEPSRWEPDPDGVLRPIPPRGDRVSIEFHYTDAAGQSVCATPSQWIVNLKTGAPLPDEDWLFSGSRMVERRGRELYDADYSGTLIGLCAFGTEVLAWPHVISPESSIDEPIWIANAEAVPPLDTPVRVRIVSRPTPGTTQDEGGAAVEGGKPQSER